MASLDGVKEEIRQDSIAKEQEEEGVVKSGSCNAGLVLVWGETRGCMWADMVCHTLSLGGAKVHGKLAIEVRALWRKSWSLPSTNDLLSL
jgi:hypothetical protein